MKKDLLARKVFLAFGTSPINYKIICGVDENVTVIVFSTKKYPCSKTITLYYSDAKGRYHSKKAKVISDTTKTDCILDFVENGIHIYIMNVYSHVNLIECLGYFHAVSCCGEELTSDYVPLLNKIACSGKIISFDNDNNIVQQAQDLSINCRIVAGIVHCRVISETQRSAADDTATILAEKHGYLFFPPACESFKLFFKARFTSPFSVFYAESEDELIEAVNRKLLNINVLHTLLCFETKLLFPIQYDSLTFGAINTDVYDKIQQKVLSLYKEMYLSLFGNDEEFLISVACAKSFIDDLRRNNENCIRGVDFNSLNALEETKRYLAFIRNAGINIEKYILLI